MAKDNLETEAKSDIRILTTNTQEKHHIKSNFEKLLNESSEKRELRLKVDEEAGKHFLSWFHESIDGLERIISKPCFLEPRLMMNIEFCLKQIGHHLAHDTSPSVRNALRYLRHYFKIYPCTCEKHSRKALEMLRLVSNAVASNHQEAGADVRAWFGNRIWVILRTIETPYFKERRQMMEINFFFEILKDYFVETKTSVYFRNAFRYLQRYFRVYPLVKKHQSEKAIEMVARIYQGLSYEFDYEAHVKPGLLDKDPYPISVPALRVA